MDDQIPGMVYLFRVLRLILFLQKNKWKDRDRWIEYPEDSAMVLQVKYIYCYAYNFCI